MDRNIERFTWVPFYEEFAYKLLEYKNNRRGLKDKVGRAYGTKGLKLSQNGKDDTGIDDIDPFSIFCSFNQFVKGEKGQQNRLAKISALKDEFNLTSEVPADFAGVPAYNPLKTWYVAGDCDKADIDALWELFECVLTYSDDKKHEFIECFNKALSIKGCRITKLSGGLYWIASDKFANYDERNRFFLYDDNTLPDELKKRLPNLKKEENAEGYLQYIDVLRDFICSSEGKYNNFREISDGAGNCVNYAQKNEDEFRAWMQKAEYSDSTIEQYVKVLKKKICQHFGVDLGVQNYNLFLLEDSDEYESTKEQIINSPDFDVYNINTSNRTPKAALEAYSRFLMGEDTSIHYWTFSPGPGACMWDKFYSDKIMGLGWTGMGDLRNYHSKEEIQVAVKEKYGGDTSHMNDVLALWQVANEIRVGDIIFVKTSSDVILGRGKVISEYSYDGDNYPDYPHLRQVEWTDKGLWHVKKGYYFASKALTDISSNSDMVNYYNALIGGGSADEYGKKEFLNEVFMDETRYNELVDILEHKKNLILQGAPGVGKTFAAKRLAYSMMGKKDDARIEMVQFHQNYSYEDFVMGYKPDDKGFVLKEGIFYNFCEKAKNDHGNKYFFIIDEINRGNLSKIFGELMMLIENDWRGHEIKLAYKDVLFSVPDNLYIVGMMNTADRSLAMIDYALRRRFSFFTLEPAFDSDGFKKYRDSVGNNMLNELLLKIERLNKDIVNDPSLGRGFQIGHSYFCGIKSSEDCTEPRLKAIVKYDILPTLEEYWFDDQTKLSEWKKELEIL